MSYFLITVLLQIGLLGEIQSSPACASVSPDFTYPKSPQLVVLPDQERVKYLKGKVTGPAGSAIAGPILIEIIEGSEHEKRVSACFADSNGYFDFGMKKKGRYSLKVSMRGFDTAYLKVVVGNFKKDTLTLMLRPST